MAYVVFVFEAGEAVHTIHGLSGGVESGPSSPVAKGLSFCEVLFELAKNKVN